MAVQLGSLELSNVFTYVGDDPALVEWLASYSEGIVLPFPITGTSFQIAVMQAMQRIPFGQTVSYGTLAQMCNHPKAARAVGNGCRRNPYPLFVPCHRVIRANGTIGGFAYDLEIKRRLLTFESSLQFTEP